MILRVKKACVICFHLLEPINFYSTVKAGKNSHTCKKCWAINSSKWRSANPERSREIQRQSKKRTYNPKKHKEITLKYLYGLEAETFYAMEKSQEYKCAICKIIPKKLVVDHDHTTKKVRGLLCHACNLAIGMLKDCAKVCNNASIYLSKSKE